MFCHQCGRKTQEQDRFCTACGTRLRRAEADLASVSAAARPEELPVAPVQPAPAVSALTAASIAPAPVASAVAPAGVAPAAVAPAAVAPAAVAPPGYNRWSVGLLVGWPLLVLLLGLPNWEGPYHTACMEAESLRCQIAGAAELLGLRTISSEGFPWFNMAPAWAFIAVYIAAGCGLIALLCPLRQTADAA
jgi:hypothetical protein